ncbi:MAG TPA: nitric oxide reductase activation protein [Gammaproteobacteria bacterium]|nr:nitric oxide reductase activation protein [Gammaproteobacteria bacterium]|tara:strand:- start:3455 stop:5605 length:2151 start_codon:yes stop_codon:yes gene_type:complete
MPVESRQSFLNRIRVQKDLERVTGTAIERQGRGAELISEIAALGRENQDFIYHWAEIIGRSNGELAGHFVNRAAAAFEKLDRNGVETWLMAAMEQFDNRGLGAGIDVLEELPQYIEAYRSRHNSCSFDLVAQFLQHFVTGLGGREMIITTSSDTYTDTEKIFLPEIVNQFDERDLNFSIFKLTAVHLWAQSWYGTWRYQVVERLSRMPDTAATSAIFNCLECIRLDACVSREFPGMYRQFEALGYRSTMHKEQWDIWRARAPFLVDPAASAMDSIALVPDFRSVSLPELKCYQGEIRLQQIREAMFARIEREKAAMKQALAELQRTLQEANGRDPETTGNPKEMGEFSLAEDGESGSDGEINFELRYDGEQVEMTAELEALLSSILQDFGEVPDEHLEGINAGMYPDQLESEGGGESAGVDKNSELKDAISYREWDYTRQRYREGFCRLSELDVPIGDETFVEDTLAKYHGLLKSIKKTFEAVLGEAKLQRRQSQGDDIDIDALVEAHADLASGREMSDYVYTRFRNLDRNIAVMFMVDMSGSTLGWVNDAERESLILLCEALETLGDRYAIYGFSGRTNKRCEIYRVKRFEEAYTRFVRERISGIRPKSYTRMGVAIRHLGHLLNMTRARTKILITLSDGRPEDYGGYKGRYGIEDTRHALLELRRDGIHSFCITIDKEAQDYLPHMYGMANYAVIDEVKKLPLKVADIYRRLTT